MIVFLDTSALVKLLVDEDGSMVARILWRDASRQVASVITYPETRATLSRAMKAQRLSASSGRAARARLEVHWSELDAVALDEDLATVAGGLADRFTLRGADAVHLATALSIIGRDIVFATWDRRLASAAIDAGLAVAPSM